MVPTHAHFEAPGSSERPAGPCGRSGGPDPLLSRSSVLPLRALCVSVVLLLAVSPLVATADDLYLPLVRLWSAAGGSPRPWPDTNTGIHVFNDQLAYGLSEAQTQFAATHYAGAQKLTRSQADQLRAISPGFIVLHYRLGEGLGYRSVTDGCRPDGDWLAIVDGDDWVQEWPGDEGASASWFFPWSGSDRVLDCDWGWYLMELGDPSWRAYWHGEVLRQVRANADDGVFMDSLSVPNSLGTFDPPLPPLDLTFESAWSTRIAAWLSWLQSQPLGAYYLVPNVGSWITTRDVTDYSAADGLMVEGFAIEADASPYALEDWRLQMNRILGATARGQAVVGQTCALGDQERMFTLGSYLLAKGARSYLNLDNGLDPEWWPEYDIPIGRPTEGARTSIEDLYDDVAGVYRRAFDNGFVLVNPTNPWDGSGTTAIVDLGGTYYLAECSRGGYLPEDGVPTGSVTYRRVSSVTLPPYSTAVLLDRQP